jgi:A/G-specific adenine glycosylase
MIEVVRNGLHRWYLQHQRSLPWRSNPEPYHIWLSEIILQQTRVDQGLSYYLRFIETYPTIRHLAAADQDEVLKLWQGLGYYSRARNLHFAANQVMDQFQGKFPNKYDDILKLKGVGSYTAAAIASIAFGEPRAVVDGNVIRVISRLFDITASVNQASTIKEIQSLADELMDAKHPSTHNQAMMEFGALQCTPKNPNCSVCPLETVCLAKAHNRVSELPFKDKKIKRRSRFFHYIIAQDKKNVVLSQRGTNDIWGGLFEFLLIENESKELLNPSQIENALPISLKSLHKTNSERKHVLSHQDIHSNFYHIEIDRVDDDKLIIVALDDLHTFALPRLIDRYLENHDLISGEKRH